MKRNFLNIVFAISCILLIDYSYGQANSLIEKKAKELIPKLRSSGEYPFYGKDTLIDLNGDHFKDILVEYYGLAGTGEKNRVTIYLYNNSANKFERCDQLCDLANPTFYFDKKIVTGYYIANGGGFAVKFKWNGIRLDSLEKIDVEVIYKNNEISFKTISFDFLTKKKTSKTFDMMTLPSEYKYGNYIPIIKKTDH